MSVLNRRGFIGAAGAASVGTMATALAAPAIAKSMPNIKWRMTTSWPKSLDTLYGGAEQFAKYVAEATDNKFQIQVFAAGEIVSGLQATDAVSSGTVEMCNTAAYYMWGKDPTFALGCAVPFGLNGRMQNAWWREGGGDALMNEFYAKHNLYGLLAGNTMTQMGGWYRKEVNTPDDLKGLKMRIGGFAGAVLSKMGVVPQQISAGEIYPSLERGTIDAAEWSGPYDDEKLGFYKVAKYYYYPGWWEGGAMVHVQINKEKWDALPSAYKSVLNAAAAHAHNFVVARYDWLNPPALKRLVGAGAQLRPFSESVLDACFAAANEVYAEIGSKNQDFNKIWESIKAARADQYLWLQVADGTYDNYMMLQQSKKNL